MESVIHNNIEGFLLLLLSMWPILLVVFIGVALSFYTMLLRKTALACLLTVLVFLLNVLYQSEVSYTEYEVTTISGSLKFSLLVLVIWAVLIVAAAFVRGRFPVRSIEEKSCFAC